MPVIRDQNLTDVLMSGDVDDISILIDLITDKGEGRISLSSDACRRLTAANTARRIDKSTRALIAEELSRFGGNSLANLFRGGAGVPYKEIVCDVATHLKVPYNASSECEMIEMAIISKVLQQSLDKMTEEQRKELFESLGTNYSQATGSAAMAGLLAALKLTGFGAFKATAIVANASVHAFLGRGLVMGAYGGAIRGLGVLAGPVAWAITAIWTAFDLASPAYRVTVPCVIQVAYMRQKGLIKKCPSCNAAVTLGNKFCGECGAGLMDPSP